jgi:hypothetical protein
MSCYQNVPVPNNTSVSPTGAEVLRNFVYGRYADGYYDQLAGWPTSSSTDALGTPPNVAMRGILMVNHYNYGSIFFPAPGIMLQNTPGSVGNSTYAMYHTSSFWASSNLRIHNTHWVGGTSPHVGMSCTQIHGTAQTGGNGSGTNSSVPHAGPVRCIKQ